MGALDTEPLSDPEAPGLEDTTRRIVIRLERQHQRAQGAATVWRAAGGIAVTVALALAAWGVTFASQAAVDHERVDRLEEDVRAMRDDLDAIRSALARIEGRLERPGE